MRKKTVAASSDPELTLKQILDALGDSAQRHGLRCRLTFEVEPAAAAATQETPPVETALFRNLTTAGRGSVEFAAPLARQLKTPSEETIDGVIEIVKDFHVVPKPRPETIVGPAVKNKMEDFVGKVNGKFGKNYVTENFDPAWNIYQTASYIENH